MISVKKLAEIIQAEIIGDQNLVLKAPNRIEFAQEGEITFLRDSKYLSLLPDSKASAVVTRKELVDTSLNITWLVVKDPYLSFVWVLEVFFPKVVPDFKQHEYKAETSSVIAPSARIGQNVYIGHQSQIAENSVLYPRVFVGNRVQIGKNATIYPGAIILDDTIIGNNCVIHSGAVIGTDGFGFVPNSDGVFQKIPQMGNVIIEDNVEIGANVCIDRATLGSTLIHEGVKLDNLIQVGHNVQIGAHTVIAAQAGIAGSCRIGEQNMIGGQAGFVPSVETAKGVKVNAQSGVPKSIKKENVSVTGSPAEPYMEFYRKQVFINNLEKEIRLLKEQIKALKEK